MLRRLEYLLAVAVEEHFGRAAVACHVSQPALSAGIAKLEAELRVPLVVRSAGGARTSVLTEEGRALLPWARETVAAAAALGSEAGRLRGALTGTLRVGTIPTATAAVASVVAPVLRDHAGVRAQIRTLPAERLAEAVRARELDAGLAYVDHAFPGLRADRLYRERLVLVSSATRWHDHEPPGAPWTAPADEPLCLLTPDMQHRRVVDAALAEAGVRATPLVEADTFGVLLDLVADGFSTIIGEPWVHDRPLPDGVRVVPLVRPSIEPWVGVLTHEGPVASPLVAALRATLVRRGRDGAASPTATTSPARAASSRARRGPGPRR